MGPTVCRLLVNVSNDRTGRFSLVSRLDHFSLIHIKTIAFIWHENMLGYLSADIICSEKQFSESEARGKL